MAVPLAQVGLVHGSGFELAYNIPVISYGSRYNADRAAELLLAGSIDKVICSGRGPVYGEDYPVTEAKLMADYLVAQDVDHNKIVVEDTSTSSVANWAYSVPIIQSLEATRVLGIAAKLCVPRMQKIGDFVAFRSGFDVVGYVPSAESSRPKGFIRELLVGEVTRRFLADNLNTSVDGLGKAYEEYKAQIGIAGLNLATAKRFIHRYSAPPSR